MLKNMVNTSLVAHAIAQPINWTVFHQFVSRVDADAIRCLIEALPTADKGLAADIETQLVKLGKAALPDVLAGLTSGHSQQQATCAMVLVRWQAVDGLAQWVAQHPEQAWIGQQLLALIPTVAATTQPVLSLV
jgi:hypothetical protein